MTFRYFDAHTHAHFPVYGAEQGAMLAHAAAAGVGMVTVGTQRDTSLKAVAMAHAYENMWATVGLHPTHTAKSFHDAQELGGGEAAKAFTSRGEEFDAAFYRDLAADPRVVAIGECGLDYFRLQGDIEEAKRRQTDALLKQVMLSREVKKPLMIHCRSAFPDLIQLLVTNHQLLITNNPGIIHFFSGTMEEAKRLLEFGFSFTFGGVITFARDYDDVIRFLPMDRILSETDAPYVAPAPYRGKRNEPAYVVEVVKKLAELKGVSGEAMAEKTVSNAKRVFGI